MKLENAFLKIEIAAAGAELMHICDLKRGTELLFDGDPTYWKRRAPVLFPNVGKTYNNIMHIGGKSYPTGQHGFARDMEFTLEEADETHAVYLLKSSEETLERYPFPFELRIVYTLEGAALKVEWKVKNTGDQDMHFTIGGHPAFCFEPGEGKQDYKLHFPGKEELHYLLLDAASGTALPDKISTLTLEDGYLPLSDELFAHDALILDGGQVEEVWLCKKDGTRRVGMLCKGFPNYGIWSVQGAPFVCLEPWMGRCDNCGFEGELSEKPGVVKLESGRTFAIEHSVVLPE